MKIINYISQPIVYLLIISTVLQLGAAAYETFVITPLWSGSLPESVTNWNPVAQYAINPGLYWMKGAVLYALCTFLMLGSAWFMPQAQRKLVLLAGILALLILIATELFFVPILIKTIFTRGAGLSSDEITRLANSWVHWNWLRFAAGITAWLAAIRALSLSN
ncbi:MAG: hypothetical protein ABWZ66_10365 [Pyrinomonadaceae bacterium]